MENEKTGINYYEYARYELFDVIMPRMIYEETGNKSSFFNLLRYDTKNTILEMLKEICREDKQPCPYETSDFETDVFERCGINYIKINMPELNTRYNITLRAYVLFAEQDTEIKAIKYFIIKRFSTGETSIIHICPNNEILAGGKLTDSIEDMEYEYWKLASDYSKLVLQDIEAIRKC